MYTSADIDAAVFQQCTLLASPPWSLLPYSEGESKDAQGDQCGGVYVAGVKLCRLSVCAEQSSPVFPGAEGGWCEGRRGGDEKERRRDGEENENLR